MRIINDDHHESELNDAMKEILDLNAHNWLREDFPTLYALVKSEVEAGRPKADILRGCARIKKMNDTILNSAEMAIDYLTRKAKS